jgi:hypothetical protein
MPLHKAVFPEIAVGGAGVVLTVTLNVCAGLVPQALTATTVITPLVLPAIAFIEVVFDAPFHPEGNIQVYDVAPATGEIEYA